ncbi:unnamed protein product, partial [Bubo scandiacus]
MSNRSPGEELDDFVQCCDFSSEPCSAWGDDLSLQHLKAWLPEKPPPVPGVFCWCCIILGPVKHTCS